MRCCNHHIDNGLEWMICEFGESFAELSLLLGDASIAEYALNSFGSEKRRKEWLATRVVLRKMLGDDASIVYDAAGKPSIVRSDKSISISHSGNYVAVAVHSSSEVGIDIELISSSVERVRARFMSHDEEVAIDKCNEKVALLLHWSAKEAFYKIIGNRGGSFLDSFRIAPFTVSPTGSFPISYIKGQALIRQCLVSYIVDSDFVFTCCVG